MNEFTISNWIADRVNGSREVWYQRLHMVGPKWGRKNYKDYKSPLAFFGFMFYFFAIFWNCQHPHMWYGGGEPIPWHGFTIYWWPNATGEPGAKLWKYQKEIFLWC